MVWLTYWYVSVKWTLYPEFKYCALSISSHLLLHHSSHQRHRHFPLPVLKEKKGEGSARFMEKKMSGKKDKADYSVLDA